MTERTRITPRVTARMVHALSVPRSREQLATEVGVALPAVSKWLKEFHLARLVRVCRWDNDSRGFPTIACFVWEPGEADCKKNVPTAAERARKRRALAKERS